MHLTIKRSSQPEAISGVTELLIYEDGEDGEAGALLAVLWTRSDGSLGMTQAGEPDFNQLLAEQGVTVPAVRTVTLKE